jgi:tripartite-type tricarboxylate transporter receptor subunit TctC
MKNTLRLLAHSGILLLGVWLGMAPVNAQEVFPSRPIRVIVPQTTGTGGDIYARLMAEKMRQELGQSVVVDNRPGANGVIAMSFLAKQQADGYTLLLAGVSQMAFNQHLYKATPYDVTKDFTYVAPTVEVPFILVASKKSGIKSPADLMALSRTKPGGVNFASGGVGNSTHLAMEMLAVRAGIKASHVPYPGTSGALLSVVSGETDVMVSPLPVALAQINSGGLVPVAVLSAARLTQVPSVPTLKESGLDVPFMPGWYALIGPAGMDQAVAQKLNAAVQKMFVDPEIKAKLDAMSMVVVGGTSAGNRERAINESRTWGELIRAQRLQVE